MTIPIYRLQYVVALPLRKCATSIILLLRHGDERGEPRGEERVEAANQGGLLKVVCVNTLRCGALLASFS